MIENSKYPKVFFILNVLLSLIAFLNIIVVKKGVNTQLFILIVSYLSMIILNRVFNRFFFKVDESLSLILNIFLLISIVILYRIDENLSVRQMFFILVGYGIYLVVMFLVKNIHEFYKYKWIYFSLTLIFMSLSFLIGKYINGSKNWVSIFGITFQPSEFGKVFLVLYIASVLRDKRCKKDKYMSIVLLLIVLSILVLQKDLGTGVIVFVLSMFMYYIKTFKYKFLSFICVCMSIGGVFAYNKFNHVRVRVRAWLHPESDPNGSSYQVLQGFFSMGSGGFLGRGLYGGNVEYIPVNTTDYIFVAIVEEFGIITGILIVLLYFLFFMRVFKKAALLKDKFESVVLLCGFSILISFQALLIIGGILNLIPLTGVTLPFISYGGSSMISMFIMFSIIQKTLEERRNYE